MSGNVTVLVHRNGDTIFKYECDYSTNSYPEVIVPYYYDLIYPCETDTDAATQPPAAMELVSDRLLDRAASEYRLKSGTACTVPPDPPGTLWLASISSEPADATVSAFGCQKLGPSVGECCTVIQGAMQYQPIGGYDPMQMMSFVAREIDSGDITKDAPYYRTAFIGSVVEASPEAGRGNLPPAINSIRQQPQQGGGDPNRFTLVGAFVLGGLIAAFIGVFAILIQRRRRFLKSMQLLRNVPLSKSDLEVQQNSNDTAGPSLEVDVMSDGEMPPGAVVAVATAMTNSFDVADDADASYPEGYRFDLGNSFKDAIMGAYGGGGVNGAGGGVNGSGAARGPTSMAVLPPYPMEAETSDSEADSWAQTDGTVGSLEERLEEITAEI